MGNDIPPQPTSLSQAQLHPLNSLLKDMQQLSDYLHGRGDKTFETATKFAQHAHSHPDTRAYDERQATMLEYQHQVWLEIAGLLDRLVTRYEELNVSDSNE